MTRRQRNEAFDTDSPDAEPPEDGSQLWIWFWDIRARQPPSFSGVTPISDIAFLAWVQRTGNIVRREESQVIFAMDDRYCSEIDKESEAISERESEG